MCWNLKRNSRASINVPYITYEDTKEIDHLEDLGINGKTILKTAVNKILWKGVFWPVADTSEDGNIPWITVGVFF